MELDDKIIGTDTYAIESNSSLNTSNLSSLAEQIFLDSVYQLEICRLINIYTTICFVVLGLVGHFLTIFVFSQKRFRRNSSNVYLLCLALNDALYLFLHLFEDTIKAYRDLFAKEENSFVNLINLIDKFNYACKLINYLRYVLRFVSAYTIIAFTLQRLSLVYSPLSNKYKTKKSAWLTFLLISLVALCANLWVPFLFEIRTEDNLKYCDVSPKWSREYFHITLAYVCIIMLFPILIISVSNSIIISNILIADSNRTHLRNAKYNKQLNQETKVYGSFSISLRRMNSRSRASSVKSTRLTRRSQIPEHSRYLSLKINTGEAEQTFPNGTFHKPYYLNISQIIKRISKKSICSRKITRLLILISFSYSLFNLPYLIAWFVFYYEMILNFDTKYELAKHNQFYSALKISEIFYLLNYSITFYIYCASGSIFRKQLKYSSKSFNIKKSILKLFFLIL